MFKRYLTLLSVIMVTLFIFSSILHACYAYLSIDELKDKSDLILIGKVKENLGADKGKQRYTNWSIEILYGLKGEINSNKMIVSTPGVRNKNFAVSTDYYLDQWESDILLLFLCKNNDKYVPITPQGVVALTKSKKSINKEDSLEGKDILNQFSINEKRIQQKEKEDIINLIKTSSISIPTATNNIALNTNINQIKDNIIMDNSIYYIVIVVIALFTLIWFSRRTKNE